MPVEKEEEIETTKEKITLFDKWENLKKPFYFINVKTLLDNDDFLTGHEMVYANVYNTGHVVFLVCVKFEFGGRYRIRTCGPAHASSRFPGERYGPLTEPS